MHELAVTQSVVDAVVERTGEQRVLEVRLRVGRLSGVVPGGDALLLRPRDRGHAAAGRHPGTSRSPRAARAAGGAVDVGLPDLILLCPCGSADVDVLTGRELAIGSVEVA